MDGERLTAVSRRKPGRVHDEVSELICNRAFFIRAPRVQIPLFPSSVSANAPPMRMVSLFGVQRRLKACLTERVVFSRSRS
jgi:hypothetical protein